MEGKEPSLSSLILGVVLFAAVAGGASYILYLRAENAKLNRPVGGAIRALPATRTLSPEQRRGMLATLQSVESGSERLVWFATTPNNPEAAAFQHALQQVFEEAGWQVRANVPVTFAIKPGVFFFMADENPPPYVLRAREAFDAAAITVTGGSGYRAFYNQKKEENPAWQGFEMAPEQTYVVVIGRQPEE